MRKPHLTKREEREREGERQSFCLCVCGCVQDRIPICSERPEEDIRHPVLTLHLIPLIQSLLANPELDLQPSSLSDSPSPPLLVQGS